MRENCATCMAFTGFVFEENRVESICNALQKSKKKKISELEITLKMENR